MGIKRDDLTEIPVGDPVSTAPASVQVGGSCSTIGNGGGWGSLTRAVQGPAPVRMAQSPPARTEGAGPT